RLAGAYVLDAGGVILEPQLDQLLSRHLARVLAQPARHGDPQTHGLFRRAIPDDLTARVSLRAFQNGVVVLNLSKLGGAQVRELELLGQNLTPKLDGNHLGRAAAVTAS